MIKKHLRQKREIGRLKVLYKRVIYYKVINFRKRSQVSLLTGLSARYWTIRLWHRPTPRFPPTLNFWRAFSLRLERRSLTSAAGLQAVLLPTILAPALFCPLSRHADFFLGVAAPTLLM